MRPKLLLVGWDAADWRILHPLMDTGQMPALDRLVEQGASGELLSTQPLVAALQWTCIATGKRAWQHGISHVLESAGNGGTVPASAGSRRALAVWEILAAAGKRAFAVGWPATHGGRRAGCIVVSDRYAEPTAGPGVRPWPPAIGGTYHPHALGSVLDPLRVSPEDIHADLVSRYVPQWLNVDQRRDRRIGQLRLFLATDFSNQTAAVKLLTSTDWEFAAIRFPALGAISQVFLPFHEPGESAGPGGPYGAVIRQGYKMLDGMLRDLVVAAGPDAAVMVVSSYGAQYSKGIADSSMFKSPYGMFLASGQGFAKDALVFGAGVLDVTPTVLSWFGLPIGEDMEGRVLVESFAHPRDVTKISTWEPAPQAPLPRSDGDATPASALDREAHWNLAQNCIEGGHNNEALPILEMLFRSFPERSEFAHALFYCQLILNKLTEAEITLQVLLETLPPGINSILPRAEFLLAKNKRIEARAALEEARGLNPSHPDTMRRLGVLMLRLRDWTGLEDLARKALALDEHEPIAWLGLAEAELRKGRAAEAEEAALKAIGLKYFLPEAHFVLARARVALGKWQQASDAMRTLLQIQPLNRSASAYFRRLEPSQAP